MCANSGRTSFRGLGRFSGGCGGASRFITATMSLGINLRGCFRRVPGKVSGTSNVRGLYRVFGVAGNYDCTVNSFCGSMRVLGGTSVDTIPVNTPSSVGGLTSFVTYRYHSNTMTSFVSCLDRGQGSKGGKQAVWGVPRGGHFGN